MPRKPSQREVALELGSAALGNPVLVGAAIAGGTLAAAASNDQLRQHLLGWVKAVKEPSSIPDQPSVQVEAPEFDAPTFQAPRLRGDPPRDAGEFDDRRARDAEASSSTSSSSDETTPDTGADDGFDLPDPSDAPFKPGVSGGIQSVLAGLGGDEPIPERAREGDPAGQEGGSLLIRGLEEVSQEAGEAAGFFAGGTKGFAEGVLEETIGPDSPFGAGVRSELDLSDANVEQHGGGGSSGPAADPTTVSGGGGGGGGGGPVDLGPGPVDTSTSAPSSSDSSSSSSSSSSELPDQLLPGPLG